MKKILSFTLFMLFFGLSIKTQNPAPPSYFEIFTTILNPSAQVSVADILAGNPSISNDSADYTLEVALILLDTINISNIHLTIGDTLNGANLYNQVIPFSSLNTTLNYREKNIVYIYSDTLNGLGDIYGKVYLEDSNGNNSIMLTFQSN